MGTIFKYQLSKWLYFNHIHINLALYSTCGLSSEKFIGNLFSTSGKIKTNRHPLISIAQAHADKNITATSKFMARTTRSLFYKRHRGISTRCVSKNFPKFYYVVMSLRLSLKFSGFYSGSIRLYSTKTHSLGRS